VTKKALSEFNLHQSVKPAINELCKLRGVGPSTASLVLSTAFPDDVPFFSDELYYWVQSGDTGLISCKAKPHKVKYNLKEYLEIYEVVHHVRVLAQTDEGERPTAEMIERAAYIIEHLREGQAMVDSLTPTMSTENPNHSYNSRQKMQGPKKKVQVGAVPLNLERAARAQSVIAKSDVEKNSEGESRFTRGNREATDSKKRKRAVSSLPKLP